MAVSTGRSRRRRNKPVSAGGGTYIIRTMIEEVAIANPWTKKNPFLSMFLTGANAAAGRLRAASVQQARRNQSAAVKQVTHSWLDIWMPKPARKRRK